MVKHMNFQETLVEIQTMASITKDLLDHDRDETLSEGDAPNGLKYRSYTLSETCAACNNAEHRTIKKHLTNLGYDPKNTFPISSVVLDELRDSLRPHRTKQLLSNAIVYAVSNFKGGAGKTTSTITLAAGLCSEIYERKLRVGVIDLDPQATLTMYARPNLTDDDFTVGDILLERFELDENETYEDFVYEAFLDTNIPNLKVLPARPGDRMYEASVIRKQFEADLEQAEYAPQEQMKKLIDSVRGHFDVILIDCSPSFGVSVTSAHYVADSLIIPVTPSQLDRDSSVKYFDFLGKLYSTVLGGFDHKGYDFINVLPTAVDEQSKSEIQTARKLRQGASHNCFSGNFLYSEAVLNTANKWQTIYSVSKSQYSGTQKTLTRIQEATFSLVTALHEQIESVALKQG